MAGHGCNFSRSELCLTAPAAAEPKTADVAAHPQAAPSIAASDAANPGDVKAPTLFLSIFPHS
jgi:hypothetical protein